MPHAEATRRGFLRTLGLGVASCAAPSALAVAQGKANPGKPNFVLILVDDLGWADVGCYGSKYHETPNIDRLARQGMRFTDGYAACAVCSPTRAAVLTGRYPARTGVTDWIHFREIENGSIADHERRREEYAGGPNRRVICPRNPLWMELDELTIAEVLKAAGYATCHVGKWHLGPEPWYPEKQGFDYNIGGCEFGQPPSYFDPYVRKDRLLDKMRTLEPRKPGEYLTDREADEAARFIREHAEKPFFLYMAHYAVHTPIQGKKSLVDKYEAKKKTNQKNPVYAAMVESVDQAVGRILRALEEAKVADNTLVIFTSDNGGLQGRATDNAPLRAGKGFPYEGGIREPVIVRWPGVVKAGAECAVPVTSVDYFPTILEAAGLEPPAGRAIDGTRLMSLLRGGSSIERDAIFWHFPHYRGAVVPYSIVRAGDWKLIRRYDGKRFELFSLREDLSEKTDLAEQAPEKVRELDALLSAWLRETSARLPKPNPRWHGGKPAGRAPPHS